jgi:pimeloyl-ACP methyl ester carboxylesterase
MLWYQTQTASIHGVQTTYYLVEPQWYTKKTCVFLHGWMSAWLHFQSIAQQLSQQGYRIVMIDLPWFAKSHEPQTPRTITDYAQRLSDTLTMLHEYWISVAIWHSFGGRVIIEYLTRGWNPHQLQQWILIWSWWLNTASSQWLSTIVQSYNKLLDNIGSVWSHIKQITHRIAKKYLYSSDYTQVSPMMQQIFSQTVRYNQWSLLSQINIPILLLRWEQDDQTPISDAHYFAQQIPHNTLVTISQAGHFAYLDDPVTVLASISHFLWQ